MQGDPPTPPEKGSLAERLVGRMTEKDARTPAHHDALSAGQAPVGQKKPVHRAEASRKEQAPAAAEPAGRVEARADDQASHTPVIQINFRRLQTQGFITPTVERNSTTEEFRVIKRQLLKSAFTEERQRRSDNSNVFMVTSSVPAEGKTFISLNLAMSLALERDLYVLLVDADNHRHSLTDQIGGNPNQTGLVDLLVDPSLQLHDIIQRTSIPNLSFIPAGRPHPHGSELLASKEMAAMMKELAMRYPDRLVIIDTPPLLASTEGVVLSSHVGHAIVVVEKDRTSKRSLHRTLQMLEGCQEVSCILNRDTTEQSFSQYAYGY